MGVSVGVGVGMGEGVFAKAKFGLTRANPKVMINTNAIIFRMEIDVRKVGIFYHKPELKFQKKP